MRQKKELDKVVIFMEILNLLFLDSGIFPTMDVQEFCQLWIGVDLNNPYKPLDEEISEMLALEDKLIDGKKTCIDNHVVAEMVGLKMLLMSQP